LNTVITPVQCREARKLLRWSRDRLAPRCGISAATLSAFESGTTDLRPEVRRVLRGVLAKAGIEFDTADEPGVRLREREARLALRRGRTRSQVTAILDELVREGALVGFRTNFDDRGPVWVPTASIRVLETADLGAVLERVERALRPLGVAEVLLQVQAHNPDGASVTIPFESIEAGKCYLMKTGQLRRVVRLMPNGQIQYEHRPPHQPNAKSWKPGMQSGRSFADLIEREVPFDWTPETDG
jgi:transcriptional regulator with XRE-family HTH domain